MTSWIGRFKKKEREKEKEKKKRKKEIVATSVTARQRALLASFSWPARKWKSMDFKWQPRPIDKRARQPKEWVQDGLALVVLSVLLRELALHSCAYSHCWMRVAQYYQMSSYAERQYWPVGWFTRIPHKLPETGNHPDLGEERNQNTWLWEKAGPVALAFQAGARKSFDSTAWLSLIWTASAAQIRS